MNTYKNCRFIRSRVDFHRGSLLYADDPEDAEFFRK